MLLSNPIADTACDVKPNPAYERRTLHPAKDSSNSMNVTNPVYETAKTSDEGDYVDMEDIDTEDEPQHKYEYVSVV